MQGQDHHLVTLVGSFQLRMCCDSMKLLQMAEEEPTLFSEMMLTEATASVEYGLLPGLQEWLKGMDQI